MPKLLMKRMVGQLLNSDQELAVNTEKDRTYGVQRMPKLQPTPCFKNTQDEWEHVGDTKNQMDYMTIKKKKSIQESLNESMETSAAPKLKYNRLLNEPNLKEKKIIDSVKRTYKKQKKR